MCPSQLSSAFKKEPETGSETVKPFYLTLSKHGLKLDRAETTTLQISITLLCNQRCRHCHLSAGPGRKENMNAETVDAVVSYAQRSCFDVIDITGGAPELNPHLGELIERLSPHTPRLMIRSNLSALNDGKRDFLIDLLRSYRVVIVASLPSLNESQTDSKRGRGVFMASICAIKRLNALGYGQKGSCLEFNLVANPTGAFLPASQEENEKRFREVLAKKWGVFFNSLFNFANTPLGRFRHWLVQSGNYERYMQKLASNFNPCAVDGVMCRTMVSVSWDGYLYDCDFNLAQGLFMGGKKIHISEMPGPPKAGSPIAVADHCYTCTAGAGFT